MRWRKAILWANGRGAAARRMDDEVIAARDKFADSGKPVKRRQHIVLVREARTRRVEFQHSANPSPAAYYTKFPRAHATRTRTTPGGAIR